jgi:hypothetical protein
MRRFEFRCKFPCNSAAVPLPLPLQFRCRPGSGNCVYLFDITSILVAARALFRGSKNIFPCSQRKSLPAIHRAVMKSPSVAATRSISSPVPIVIRRYCGRP